MRTTVLEFPFFDLTDEDETTIRLTMNGKNPKTFSGATLEEAAEAATEEVARHAARLKRPVKARLTVNRDKVIRNTVVFPDGQAEIQTSQAIVDKKPFYKKPAVIVSLATLLLMGIGGAGYAYHAATTPAETASIVDTAPANTTINGISSTTLPLISSDSRFILYSEGNAVKVATTATGEIIDSLAFGESPESVTFRVLPNTGYVVVWGKHIATWSESQGFSDSSSFPSGQKMLVTRSGETVTVAKSTASQPESVEIAGTGKTFSRPSEGASFLYVRENLAYWATTEGGGTIVSALESGEVQKASHLAAPAENAELASWLGISDLGEVVTLWKVGEGLEVATQKPDSDAVSNRVAVSSSENKALTQTGNLLLLDHQVINLNTMESHSFEGDLQEVSSKAVGFTATLDGSPVFINEDGLHRTSTGALLGFSDTGTPLILEGETLTIDREGNNYE